MPEEVAAAIDAILPAIEIVDSRCVACDRLDPLWKLADNQINGGLVIGRVHEDWSRIDAADQPVRLSIDGATVVEGRGGNTAGDTLRLLVWMANHTGAHCGGLEAGQIITTGSGDRIGDGVGHEDRRSPRLQPRSPRSSCRRPRRVWSRRWMPAAVSLIEV